MVKQKYHFLAQSLPPNSRKEIGCRGDKGGGKKGMEGWAERERGKERAVTDMEEKDILKGLLRIRKISPNLKIFCHSYSPSEIKGLLFNGNFLP